jgi:hypothetical protein
VDPIMSFAYDCSWLETNFAYESYPGEYFDTICDMGVPQLCTLILQVRPLSLRECLLVLEIDLISR